MRGWPRGTQSPTQAHPILALEGLLWPVQHLSLWGLRAERNAYPHTRLRWLQGLVLNRVFESPFALVRLLLLAFLIAWLDAVLPRFLRHVRANGLWLTIGRQRRTETISLSGNWYSGLAGVEEFSLARRVGWVPPSTVVLTFAIYELV